MHKQITGWMMVAVLALTAYSATAADEKASATGTWKWSMTRNDQKVDMSVKLTQDGEKLTGAFVGPDGKEVAITDGKVSGDEISFSVTRDATAISGPASTPARSAATPSRAR